jgi:hypothetical protein
MRPLALLLLVLLLPFGGARAEAALRVDGGLALSPVWDSNPRRTTGAPPVSDGALLLLGDGALWYLPTDSQRLSLSWEGGARIYGSERAQDELINRLRLLHEIAFGSVLQTRLGASLEDHAVRDGDREFTTLGGEAELEVLPDAWISPRLRGSLRRFDYAPDPRWSFDGHGASLGFGLRPGGHHLLAAAVEQQWLDFGEVRTDGEERHDRLRSLSLDWTHRGRVIVGSGWQLAENETNAPGNRWVRHRLHALFGGRLPFLDLLLTARATLQLLRFSDGLQIDPEFLHIEQERGENLSSVSLKLSRPLGEYLSLELRYQLHASTFLERVLPYERHMAGAGVAIRL